MAERKETPKEATKNADIEHMIRMLQEYKYYMDLYELWHKKYERLSDKLNEECQGAKGISYDKEPTGVKTVAVSTYMNELILEEASAEIERDRAYKRMIDTEEEAKIQYRLRKLSGEERELIEARYFQGYSLKQMISMTQYKYANESALYKRIQRILQKMIEIE